MAAASIGASKTIRLLLLRGADVDVTDEVCAKVSKYVHYFYVSHQVYTHVHVHCKRINNACQQIFEIFSRHRSKIRSDFLTQCGSCEKKRSMRIIIHLQYDILPFIFCCQKGRTALVMAVEGGHVSSVGVLLDFMHSVDNRVQLST